MSEPFAHDATYNTTPPHLRKGLFRFFAFGVPKGLGGDDCVLGVGLLDFARFMELTRQQVMTWAASDVLEAGGALQAAGAVQGVRAQGELLAGSVRMGASRLVARIRVRDGKVAQTLCPCGLGRVGKVCQHAVAVGLQWAHDHPVDAPETTLFAAERAPTRLEIERWAGGPLLARAEGLVRQGAVSRIAFDYPTGRGYVMSGGAPILATFTMLKNGLVEGHCPCATNRDRGLLCEHVIAVALGVMRHYGSAERLQAAARDRAHAARMAAASGLIRRGAGGRPALARVFLPGDVAKQFAAGQVRVGVRLYVEGKPFRPQELPPATYAFSPGDENLLGMLEDIAGGPFGDTLTLRRADFLALLRCAAASWVGSAADKRRLEVRPDPLPTPLVVTADPEHDCLRAALDLPPGGTVLAEGHAAFWLGGGVARPLAHVLPGPLQSLYAHAERIPRAYALDFLTREVARLAAWAPLDAERSVSADLFTATPVTPRLRLTLKGSEVSVAAKLFAGYGEVWVAVGTRQAVALPDPDDFYHCLVRNDEAEAAALKRLRDVGFPGLRGDDLGALTGLHEVRNFLGETLPALRRAGWQVETEGPLTDFLAHAETITPTVRVREGKGGAFEVAVDYVSPRGGLLVTPDDVARAVRERRAYIKKGGRVALLDLGAVRAVRETLASCHARRGTTPGGAQVEAVHAPFVQAALERLGGIDFEASPDWKARAERQNRRRRPEPVPLGALEGTLRPYQKEGVYWLRFLEECGFCGILADEMGLGKTLQTLTWLSLPRCREEARRAPALIVCPTSLVENWRREAARFVPGMKTLTLSGPDRAARFPEVPEADLVITSYALIQRDVAFHAACRWSAVVLDEAQAIKNQCTQNAQAVKQLVADTRLVLSGTPIENGVADLWSIMDFLMPRYFGPYDDFRVRYEDPVAEGGRAAEEAQARLRAKLHPFLLRRVKKDVAADLPNKIRSVTYCALTPDQRQVYDTLRAELREKMRGLVREKGFDKSKFEVLALLMRLRQVCCDLRLLKDRQPRPGEAPSAKLDALMELLGEAVPAGHRLLVFSQFTSMLRLIAARLDAEGLDYCYLDGATKDRLAQCTRFNQTPSIPVFLISLKAGGTGLNLTGADTVVHFDPWWNPAAEEQATDRAHRIGQKKTVQAIKLIAQDTVEEKVLDLQRKKQALIEATVNASDASIVASLTMAEIEDLLT